MKVEGYYIISIVLGYTIAWAPIMQQQIRAVGKRSDAIGPPSASDLRLGFEVYHNHILKLSLQLHSKLLHQLYIYNCRC